VARRLRFGTHVIDLATRELRDDGRLLQVSPRVFDCIAYLIEHRDRAVGRDELMASVWGRADIADTQLGQVVLRARRAAGDSGDAQLAIRTVVGFGYRWVAETVEDDTDAALPADPAPDPAPVPVAPAARRVPLIVLALLLVAAGALGWTVHNGRQADPTPVAAAPAPVVATGRTIAITPARVDATAEWDWLRLGAMELIAGRLRGAGQIVIPSENVIALAQAAPDPRALADAVHAALHPRWIVASTFLKADAGWIVRLQLRAHGHETREFQGQADDAIRAAGLATAQLLATLGAPADAAAAPPDALEEWLSRIDAAVLVEDLDSARQLLRNVPEAMRTRPALRLRQAEVDFTAGQNEAAAAALQDLLDGLPAESDVLVHARAVALTAAVQVRLGRAAEAEHSATKALALLEGHDAPALIGKSFMRRGVARARLGRADEALADLAQARIALQLAGDTLGIALVELNEGALSGIRNQPAEALASFVRAEAHFRPFGASSELAIALTNQVVAHRALLQPDQALAASERSLALLGHLANVESTQLVEVRRAQALADVGQWREAEARLDSVARAPDLEQQLELAATVANERARIALARGQPEVALGLVQPLIERLTAREFAGNRLECWETVIRALHALDRDAEAATAATALAEWARHADDRSFTARLRLVEAGQAERAGRFDEADDRYGAALAAAGQEGVPADIAQVAIAYATALLARGDITRAVPVAGRLDRYASRSYDAAVVQVRLYRALRQAEAWRRALDNARALAGERPIPADLAIEPGALVIGPALPPAGQR